MIYHHHIRIYIYIFACKSIAAAAAARTNVRLVVNQTEVKLWDGQFAHPKYRGTCIVTVVRRQGRILIIVCCFLYMPTLRHSYRYYPIRVRYRIELSLYVNKCVCAAEVARLRYLGVRRWTGVASCKTRHARHGHTSE